MNETTKHVIDGAALFTAVGTVLQFIPAIAGIFSIIWLGLNIWEKITGKTISQLLGKDKKDAA